MQKPNNEAKPLGNSPAEPSPASSSYSPATSATGRGADADAIGEIAAHFEAIIRLLGEDPAREGLLKTPMRAAKALWHNTKGYRQDPQSLLNGALFESRSKEMVMVADIEFYSTCEHHILPFFGSATVAYIPAGRVIGISKLARIVDHCARKLQVQERMTLDIAALTSELTGSPDVMVAVEAGHLCMKMRGVEKQGATTLTSATLGRFDTDASLRSEFFTRLAGSRR